MSRRRFLLVLVAAGSAGLFGIVPGSDLLAARIGVAKAHAQDEVLCPNTNCLGAADCSYMQAHKCRLGNSECVVRNCVG